MVADPFVDLLRVEGHVDRQLPGERPGHRRRCRGAAAVHLVVGQHRLPDPGQFHRVQFQDLALDADPHLLRGGVRGAANQPAKHLQHPQRTLQGGRRCRVDPLRDHAQHVTGNGPDRAQRHGFLTEARQHPFDVVHEHRAGAHDEHPALLEAGPVGVQQIGGAVQGHDGLAGAGTAADDRHPLVGGADGLVLLRLDGGDDVAHGAAPGPGQGRHQRALPEDRQVGLGAGVQQVVLQADDVIVAATQHATSDHVHGGRLGGAIERFGSGGPPVDHQGLVLGVADPEPADVAGLGEVQVEPTENQSLVFRVEDRETFRRLVGEGVAFEQGGSRLLPQVVVPVRFVDLCAAAGECPGAGRGGREVFVDPVNVCLFQRDFAL